MAMIAESPSPPDFLQPLWTATGRARADSSRMDALIFFSSP
jgi:hypothetical protein